MYVFIAAMLAYGEDFDTNPQTKWSREILSDKNMDQDMKALLLQLRNEDPDDPGISVQLAPPSVLR